MKTFEHVIVPVIVWKWGTFKKDIAEMERMLKAFIKFLEKKTLDP